MTRRRRRAVGPRDQRREQRVPQKGAKAPRAVLAQLASRAQQRAPRLRLLLRLLLIEGGLALLGRVGRVALPQLAHRALQSAQEERGGLQHERHEEAELEARNAEDALLQIVVDTPREPDADDAAAQRQRRGIVSLLAHCRACAAPGRGTRCVPS
eukprot:4688651-Prymnesium_polylepis.1